MRSQFYNILKNVGGAAIILLVIFLVDGQSPSLLLPKRNKEFTLINKIFSAVLAK